MVEATSALTYKDVSVALDVEYFYSVKAVAADNRGSSFDETGKAVTVYTPLDYVTGIVAKADKTTVHLSWDKLAGAAKYNVYRVQNAEGKVTDWGKPIATVEGTKYDDTKLTAGKYTYTVVGVAQPQETGRTARVNATGATVTV